jgi:gas vesicle protein
MNETDRTSGAALILAFLAGAAAGAAAALLTAPRTGRETRKRIRAMTREAADRAAGVPAVLDNAYARAAEAARAAFVQALNQESAGDAPEDERSH